LDTARGHIDLVRVEAHRASDGADLSRGRLRRVLNVLPLEGVFDDLRAIRDRRDATKCDSAVLPVVPVHREGDGHGSESEVVDLTVLELAPPELHPAGRVRDGDVGHELAGLEDVLAKDIHAWPGEVLVEADRLAAVHAVDLCGGV